MGDLPGHEFHGNQYGAEGSAQEKHDEVVHPRVSIDQGILSPSGHVSGKSRSAAQERVRQELFGKGGLRRPEPVQPGERESLLRQARELRDLASRGMHPRSYLKKAEELEKKAG